MRAGRIITALILALLVILLAVTIWFRVSENDNAGESPPPAEASATIQETPEAQAPTDTGGEETAPPVSESMPEKNLPQVDLNSWELRLVNNDNPLPSDFVPEVTALENGQYFDSRAVSALQSFVDGARAAGLSVIVSSSYRSYATQQTLFNNKVNQYLGSAGSREAAEAVARTIVAYPGTSEHQTALAADIVDKYYEYMNESLAETELSKWMKENCAEYGFILRFPDGKQDITGIMFEPWHYRYVGVEAARYIMENELCLEEFVALVNGV